MLYFLSVKQCILEFEFRSDQGHTLVYEYIPTTRTFGFRDVTDGEFLCIPGDISAQRNTCTIVNTIVRGLQRTRANPLRNQQDLHRFFNKDFSSRRVPLPSLTQEEKESLIILSHSHFMIGTQQTIAQAFHRMEVFDRRVGSLIIHPDNRDVLPVEPVFWGAEIICSDQVQVDMIVLLSTWALIQKPFTDFEIEAVTFKPIDHI